MRVGDSLKKLASSNLAVLVLWATAGVLLHNELATHDHDLASLLCTSQYRDERTLDKFFPVIRKAAPF
jgi:hypothetical protein